MLKSKLLGQFGEALGQNESGFKSLTPREKEVLRLVAQGTSNKEIAAHYRVSESRVKTHLKTILGKLRAKNRIQAVVQATAQGLLDQS